MSNKSNQKDNSTFTEKVTLRRTFLDLLDTEPVVMETHGGYGALYRACYGNVAEGVVIEKKPEKAAALAKQRPGWFVYEADAVVALEAGVGGVLPINFVDFDPYGSPWEVVDAFFGRQRAWPDRLGLVVNDGLRQGVKMKLSWNVDALRRMVEKYGNDLNPIYLEVCREMLTDKATQVGYTVEHFAGYYCGHAQQMTHYGAILSYVGSGA